MQGAFEKTPKTSTEQKTEGIFQRMMSWLSHTASSGTATTAPSLWQRMKSLFCKSPDPQQAKANASFATRVQAEASSPTQITLKSTGKGTVPTTLSVGYMDRSHPEILQVSLSRKDLRDSPVQVGVMGVSVDGPKGLLTIGRVENCDTPSTKGVGTALVKVAEDLGRDAGATRLRAKSVLPESKEFWEKLGFTQGEGADDVHYYREIPPK